MDASEAVTELYEEHPLGLTRLAFMMLGDRPAAADGARRRSAEATVLAGEERREAVAALRRLPGGG